MKLCFSSNCEKLNAVVRSKFYAPALALLSLFFFITGLDIVGILLFSVIFAITLMFVDREYFALAPIFMMLFQMSFRHNAPPTEYFATPIAIVFFAMAVVIILASVAVYILKIRPMRSKKLSFKRMKMFVPMCAVAAACVVGGLFHSPYDFSSLLYAAGIAACFVFFYLGLALFTDDSEDARVFICNSMVYTMLLICAELAVFYAFNFASYGEMNSEWKGSMVIGWGMSNTIGSLLVMLIPAAYYLINKNINPILNYVFVFIAIVATYFTMSRTAILIGVPMCVVLSVITFFKKPVVRKTVGLMSALFVLIVIAFAATIYLSGNLHTFASFFIENSIAESGDIAAASRGRTEIWAQYLELFTSAPLFGVGFYNAFYALMSPTMTMFSGMAHNTILQFLGSCGIVGIAGYLYHRYASIKLYIKDYSYEKLMFAAGCAALVLMSLLDVFFISPYFTLFYSAYLVLSEGCKPQNNGAQTEVVVSAYDVKALQKAKKRKE